MFAFFLLVVPPALFAAILTAILLHSLGVVSLHQWGLSLWLLSPARFVALCYPLLIFGAGLLAATLYAEPDPITIGFVAFAFGAFSGAIIAWFPDPAILEVTKAARAVYSLVFGALFATWGSLAVSRRGAA